MIVLAIIAIIAIAAVAIYVSTNNGGNDKPDSGDGDDTDPVTPTGIDIVDSEGNAVHLDAPLTSCYVVNTLVPTAMKILGLQDNVDEIMFYKSSKYDYFHDAGFSNITKDTPLYSTLANAEYFISHGVKYIIESPGSSPLGSTVESACKNAGITIIKLDCFGETMVEDMQKLVKIFGSTEASQKAYDDYMGVRNGVLNTLASKSTSKDNLFLYAFMGISAFYNKEAELSKIAEKYCGKNALTEIGASTQSSTNKANETGLKEKLVELNGKKPISLLLLRGSGDDQADTLLSKWNKSPVNQYLLDYIDGAESRVYYIDSDLVTGSMDYIGQVSMAEIVGIDTGYSVKKLVEDYEAKYSFPKSTSIYTWQVQFDSGGNATAVVDAGIDTRNL